jgi:transcriptional regulator with XRE-family HTH domain
LGGLLMKGMGAKLRVIRQKWGLTLREVEERSARLAKDWGNPSYRISASWLDRVEREDRRLSAAKLIVLAVVYSIPADQLLEHVPSHYRRGLIGRLDTTMNPMIPGGSIVLINIQRRTIAHRREWTNEFDRPVYFLLTHAGFVCGWCALDKEGEWLTLDPHPLYYAASSRWRYRKEVEVIGRIAVVLLRLEPPRSAG